MAIFDSETQIQTIRAAFSTWLADRGLFMTLGLVAQVQFMVDPNLEAPIAISISPSRMTIIFRPLTLLLFDVHRDGMFFLLMHELRHIHQLPTFTEWDRLFSLAPIDEAVYERVPALGIKRSEIFRADTLLDLKHWLQNVATDAALHEDLIPLFPKGTMDQLSDCLFKLELKHGNKNAVKGQGVTVQRLNEELQLAMKPGQDWLYYVKQLIDWYANQIRRDDEFLLTLLDLGIAKKLQTMALDGHEWTEAAGSSIRIAIEKAGLESSRLQSLNGQQTSKGPGNLEGEEVMLYESRRKLNDRIKQALKMIQQYMQRWAMPGYRERQSFARPHRFLSGLPGKLQTRVDQSSGWGVLVLDTSGSMWVPEFVEQMLGAARFLQQRNLIKTLYSCDVALRPLCLSASSMVRMEGGGGTAWTLDHHTQVLKDHGLEKGLRILYLTDGDAFGLEEAKADSRVELHVLNIPRLLD